MRLNYAAKGSVHPFCVEKGTPVFFQQFDILHTVGIVAVKMEGNYVGKLDCPFLDFCVNPRLFEPSLRMIRTGSPHVCRKRLFYVALAKPFEHVFHHRHRL